MSIFYLSRIEKADRTRVVTTCENLKHTNTIHRPLLVAFIHAHKILWNYYEIRRRQTESLGSVNIRAEIYKPQEKFGSKINNDVKSFRGVET